MKTLALPADLQACVEWLRAINTQSWRAGPPPALPARPAVNPEAQAFYDYLAPVYTHTVQVWQGLASFRGG
jgi:hypothetical protein